MPLYLFIFTYKSYTVEYHIMARNKHVANQIARQQERAWRTAIDARERDAS